MYGLGADIEALLVNDLTALRLSVHCGHVATTQLLIGAGQLLSWRPLSENSVHCVDFLPNLCCYLVSVDIQSAFCDLWINCAPGADLQARTKNGKTPLMRQPRLESIRK